MKIIFTITLLLYSNLLFSQELDVDTSWIELEAETLYSEAEQITNVLYNYLELDYLIENIDTLSDKNKMRVWIYQEQREKLLTAALNCYNQITIDYVSSKLYHKALYNKGLMEFELKMYDKAKQSFLSVLNRGLKDEEDARIDPLIEEPYSNYRNHAAEMLYEIEFAQGNYNEAREYLEESTMHQYYHWCGNAYEEKEFWLSFQRSKIESKFGNYDEATKLIIPHLFNRRIIREEELREYTLKLLFQMKTKEELLKEFEIGINNFYTRRVGADSDYENYFIKFLDGELEIDIYTPENKEDEIKLVKEHIELQWIYNYIKSK